MLMGAGASGYATISDPFLRGVVEWDTVNCSHCGAVIRTKPGTVSTVYLLLDPITLRWHEEPGAGCFVCNKPVCLTCHAAGRCLPLEQQLEQAEKRGRLHLV